MAPPFLTILTGRNLPKIRLDRGHLLGDSKDLGGGGSLISGGRFFLASRASFARELAKAFLSPCRSLGPAIIAGIMACESAVPSPLADVAIN